MAPRVPVPLREIVYTLSPYQQEVFVKGVTKLPGKVAHFFQRVSAGLPSFVGAWQDSLAAAGPRPWSLTPRAHPCTLASPLQNIQGLLIFNTLLWGPIV